MLSSMLVLAKLFILSKYISANPTGVPSSMPSSSTPTGSPSSSNSIPSLGAVDGLEYFNGNSYELSGSSYEVITDFPNRFNLSEEYTISTWLYLSDSGNSDATTIFSLGLAPSSRRKLADQYIGYFSLHLSASKLLLFSSTGFLVSSSSGAVGEFFPSDINIDSGIRTHITFVHSFSTGGFFYINGALAYSIPSSSLKDTIIPSTYLCIGGDCSTNSRFLTGTIDNIRIYGRSLSESDVSLLYSLTSVPTAVPTIQPTTFVPTSSPTYKKLCLRSVANDIFGDGWDSARLVYFSSFGKHVAVTVHCQENNIYTEYCFDPAVNQDGDYVVLSVLGFRIDHYWEIFWQVINEAEGRLYSGGFDTSLTFIYHEKVVNGTLKYSLNLKDSVGLLEDSTTCKSCVDYTHDPKVRKGSGHGVWKRRPKTLSTTSISTSETSRTLSQSSRLYPNAMYGPPKSASQAIFNSKPAPANPSSFPTSSPVVKGVPYSLASPAGSIWFHDDFYGASFTIFDANNQLEYSGTTCSFSNDNQCNIVLPDGNYYWRVNVGLIDSAERSGYKWEFCGVKGVGVSELKFSMQSGSCVPKLQRNITDLCLESKYYADSFDTVTLQGVVELTVVNNGNAVVTGSTSLESDSSYQENQKLILEEALREEFQDALDGGEITSSSTPTAASSSPFILDHNSLSISSFDYLRPVSGLVMVPADVPLQRSRTLHDDSTTGTTSLLHLTFTAKLPLPRFGVEENHNQLQIEDAVSDFQSYLEKSMRSGAFTTRVVSLSKRSEVGEKGLGLGHIAQSKLISLTILHETVENKSLSTLGNSVIVIGAVVGILFGLIITMRWKFSSMSATGSGVTGSGVMGSSYSRVLDESDSPQKDFTQSHLDGSEST